MNVNYGKKKKKFLTKSIFNNNNNKMDIEKLKNSLINQKDININNKRPILIKANIYFFINK